MIGSRWIFMGVFTVVLAGLFLSCGSGPATDDNPRPGTETQADSRGEVPTWVEKYPVDPDYFIGVGSSNTGDRGDDMDRARLDALTALSASIVTKIEAEIVVESTDDTEGNAYEKITQRIQENVKQNLKGVEPVDSFYSQEDGYWFYYRFPKSKLEEMREELKQRVLNMTGPAIEDGYASVTEGIALLWDGYSLIRESPFLGTLDARIGPYSGALIDILQKELTRLSASLGIDVAPEEIVTEAGENPELKLSCVNDLGIPTGQVHLTCTGDGELLTKVITDREGKFSGKVEFPGNRPGRRTAVWRADFSVLGIDEEDVRLFVPETSMFLEIQKKSLGLLVRTGSGGPFEGLEKSVSSLFSEKLPFEIVEVFVPEKTNIVFTLYFRDLPENDYGLFFTFARAVISLERNGKTVYSYETDEWKEGGITIGQARERGKAKLFEALETNSVLFNEIQSAAAF